MGYRVGTVEITGIRPDKERRLAIALFVRRLALGQTDALPRFIQLVL